MWVKNVRAYEYQPVVGSDIPAIYALASLLEGSWYRVCGQGLPTLPEFEATLYRRVHFINKIVSGSDLLGVCSVYNFDAAARTAWCEAVVMPREEVGLSRASVYDHMAELACENWVLRKLYVEHVSFETPPLADTKLEWEEEARLEGTVLSEGFYWDRVICAMWLHDSPTAATAT